MRSGPKTPQPVAVWKEVGRVQMCVRGIEKERERQKISRMMSGKAAESNRKSKSKPLQRITQKVSD